jgi:Zn finger protein HypA/HybF involved in hydrogenase expression
VIHENSIKSYHEELALGNTESYGARILELLAREDRPMTDREIQAVLGVGEKSNIQPEITRFVQRGVLYEYDRVECSYTGKTVRRTKIFLHCPHCHNKFQMLQARDKREINAEDNGCQVDEQG